MENQGSSSEFADTQILVAKASQGDENALQALFSRYYERIRPMVRARLGADLRRKVGSDDVICDAFTRALRSIQSFQHRTEGAFLNWISTIVTHTILDNADHYTAIKRGGKARVIGGEKAEEILAAQPCRDLSPSKSAELREAEERLNNALDKLEEKKREVLILSRFQHLSYAEIAEIMKCDANTARMRVVRAEAALAKVYAQMERGEA